MKKIVRLTEEDVSNLVTKVIAELSPSIKNRSALAANKYKDEIVIIDYGLTQEVYDSYYK
jgi:hypothetical protein